MTTIGLIGGTSWESTAVYYRLLNEGIRARRGGLHSAEILLHSLDFAPLAARMTAGDWDGVGDVLAASARRLERGGADCVLLCTNTMHKVADCIVAATRLPFLDLVDLTAKTIAGSRSRRPLLLATGFTMEQPFYRERLAKAGLAPIVPGEADRAAVHQIIFAELCRGVVSPQSKERFLEIIVRATEEEGADGVILGCTEIGLLISQADVTLPVFDTTALHVEAALDFALAAESQAA
jgi:aspartate racemase